jgi:hypothetical protein
MMNEYPKIETIFDRDPATHGVVWDRWRTPEFEYLQDAHWLWTEKVDGTNIRIMWDGQRLTFGGRTDNAQIPAFLIDRLRQLFEQKSAERCSVFGLSNVVLYGEGYGNKIQKTGHLYLADSQDFVLFDVRVNDRWLEYDGILSVAEGLSIPAVPVVGGGCLHNAASMAMGGFDSMWGEFMAEGLVVRPAITLLDRRGNRIMGKIKYRDFRAQEDQKS